jgi:hypothetical protein
MKRDFVRKLEAQASGLGRSHDISDIFISFTFGGLLQFFAFFHLCAKAMKSFIIGHAHSRPFHLSFNFSPSLFHAHATVVI